MPARIDSGNSGQAARIALHLRESGFPWVRVENHATVIVVNGETPATSSVTRRERYGGNLVDMVTTGRSVANDLDHPVQAIGIGKHLTVTVDDSEKAHGAVSILAIDPGNSH